MTDDGRCLRTLPEVPAEDALQRVAKTRLSDVRWRYQA